MTTQKQITISVDSQRLTLLGHASFLYDDNGEHMGMVVVFDDLTQLQKMQRMAAWREVARRIAHEVKNPLTPIQLSAQRLRRRYLDRLQDDGQVFDECTRVIINEVDEMKRLVNEFSAFAKMPSCMPAPGDLNKVVQDAVALYRQAHPEVTYEITIDETIPKVEIDAPQMNRAIVNLLENATTAVLEGGNSQRRFPIRRATMPMCTSHPGYFGYRPRHTAQGQGATVRALFFHEAGRTGLALVIVNRIVSDHNGFIRVRDNAHRHEFQHRATGKGVVHEAFDSHSR